MGSAWKHRGWASVDGESVCVKDVGGRLFDSPGNVSPERAESKGNVTRLFGGGRLEGHVPLEARVTSDKGPSAKDCTECYYCIVRHESLMSVSCNNVVLLPPPPKSFFSRDPKVIYISF